MTRGLLALALCACANAGPDASDASPPDVARPDVFHADGAPACTLFPNAGCDAGACDLGTAGAVACRATGSGTETTTCTATDCAAGYTCFSDVGLGFSCVKLCHDDTPCAGPAGICALTIAGGVSGCSQACNPLTASGCPATWGCQVDQDVAGSRFYTHCTVAGLGGQGAACSKEEDCKAGYNCSPGSVCLFRCIVGGTGGCTAFSGTSCVALSTHPKLGTTEYGVCHN